MHVSIVSSKTFHHQKQKLGSHSFRIFCVNRLQIQTLRGVHCKQKAIHSFVKRMDLKDTSAHRSPLSRFGIPFAARCYGWRKFRFLFSYSLFRPALHLPSLAPGGCEQRHLSAGGENDID